MNAIAMAGRAAPSIPAAARELCKRKDDRRRRVRLASAPLFGPVREAQPRNPGFVTSDAKPDTHDPYGHQR